MGLTRVPQELLIEVLSHVDYFTLKKEIRLCCRHFCDIVDKAVSSKGKGELTAALFRSPHTKIPKDLVQAAKYRLHPALLKLQLMRNSTLVRVSKQPHLIRNPGWHVWYVGFYPNFEKEYVYDVPGNRHPQDKDKSFVHLYETLQVVGENITSPPCAAMTFTLHWPFPTIKGAAAMRTGCGPSGSIRAKRNEEGNLVPITIYKMIAAVIEQMGLCMRELERIANDGQLPNIVHGFEDEINYSRNHDHRRLHGTTDVPSEVIEKLGGKPLPYWCWQDRAMVKRRISSRIGIKENPALDEDGVPSVHLDLFFHTTFG